MIASQRQTPAKQTSFLRRLPMVLFLLVALALAGCSSFNCTRFENYIGEDTDLIAFSYTIAEKLASTAMPPLVPRHPEMPVLVTTFVDNDNLNVTSRFGRILEEYINSRLVQMGYTVKEIKLSKELEIQPNHGETILSRDMRRLSDSAKAQAVLVGTISITDRTMYISARLINPVNSDIISSGDYRLCMDDNILAMYGLTVETHDDAIAEPHQSWLDSILY